MNMNKENKSFDKSAKTSGTDIFYNLLNLDSIKDVQLLQSWSVLGYFPSCLNRITRTNIGLYN